MSSSRNWSLFPRNLFTLFRKHQVLETNSSGIPSNYSLGFFLWVQLPPHHIRVLIILQFLLATMADLRLQLFSIRLAASFSAMQFVLQFCFCYIARRATAIRLRAMYARTESGSQMSMVPTEWDINNNIWEWTRFSPRTSIHWVLKKMVLSYFDILLKKHISY